MAWTGKTTLPLLATTAALFVLVACDNGPSAVEKQAAGTQMAAAPDPAPTSRRSSGGPAEAEAAIRQIDGKPIWSANRRNTAEENAQRSFERNGEAFGARDLDQFIRKAHAFVGHPPAGTLTLERANGDTLFYDPKANVFAVANQDGAPRTMFKPDEGMAYWEKQKARETSRRTASSGRGRDDDA